jgi:hypothetical protein
MHIPTTEYFCKLDGQLGLTTPTKTRNDQDPLTLGFHVLFSYYRLHYPIPRPVAQDEMV